MLILFIYFIKLIIFSINRAVAHNQKQTQYHVDNLRIANKKPLAGAETRIDVEDVLAESLMQYTMLETAMTIKLITPTPSEVRMVAEYNMTHK